MAKTTLKQKKLAKLIVENLESEETLTGGQMLEKVGYSEGLIKHPGRVISQEGVQQELERLLPDEYLNQAHRELLDHKRIDYFVFPKEMLDEEIEKKVNDVGIEVINIQPSLKGKYAFYSVLDANARKAALDMAFKRKGSYAPEKRQSVNVNLEVNSKSEQIKDKYEEELRKEIEG